MTVLCFVKIKVEYEGEIFGFTRARPWLVKGMDGFKETHIAWCSTRREARNLKRDLDLLIKISEVKPD